MERRINIKHTEALIEDVIQKQKKYLPSIQF